jgi:transcriptional regulator with XRE-family HTH domain
MPRQRTIGDVIAARVRSYRKGRGWSIKTLAEECARLGAPQLTVPSLTNIERGQNEDAVRKGRDVTVEELVILGYALAVPPLLLAVPLGENEDLEITSEAKINPHLAWKVITGEEALAVTGNVATRLQDWYEAQLPVQWFRLLNEAQNEYHVAEGRLRVVTARDDAAGIATESDRLTDAIQRWAEAANRILQGGLQVPEYPAETVEQLKATGLIERPELLEISEPEGGHDGVD